MKTNEYNHPKGLTVLIDLHGFARSWCDGGPTPTTDEMMALLEQEVGSSLPKSFHGGSVRSRRDYLGCRVIQSNEIHEVWLFAADHGRVYVTYGLRERLLNSGLAQSSLEQRAERFFDRLNIRFNGFQGLIER